MDKTTGPHKDSLPKGKYRVMKTDGAIKGFIVDPSKADIDNEAK